MSKYKLNKSVSFLIFSFAILLSLMIPSFSTHAESKTMVPSTAWADSEPYEIKSPEDLAGLQVLVNSKNMDFSGKTITLVNDIDFSNYITDDGSDYNWGGIGLHLNGTLRHFKGTFDGNGHIISNLKTLIVHEDIVDGRYPTAGLFNGIENATVKNLIIKDVDFSIDNTSDEFGTGSSNSKLKAATNPGVNSGVAGVSAYAKNSTVENIKVSGYLSNIYRNTGGIIGSNIGSTIKNCHVEADVEGKYKAESISGCFVGGICGYSTGEISGCSVTGNIKGSQYVGGIAGQIKGSKAPAVARCIVNKDTTIIDRMDHSSSAPIVAGICSSIKAPCTIEKCINLGAVSSQNGKIGGIIAEENSNAGNCTVKDSYSYGRILLGENTDCQVASEPNRMVFENVYYNSEYGKASSGDVQGVTEATPLQFKDRTVVEGLNNGLDTPIWFQNVDYPDFSENMVAVDTISLDESAEVELNKDITLNVSVMPDTATNKRVTFKSSDETIATVSDEGKVTGVAVGETEITATALYDGKTAICKVTVTESNKTPETTQPTTEPPKVTPTKPATESNTVAIKKGTKFTSKGYKYTVTSNLKKNLTVTVTGYKNKKLAKISVPATVRYKNVTFKVTAIAKKAFKNQKKAKSVIVGNNVATIGTAAFAGDVKLKSATIGVKVKTIGAKTFFGDKKLKKIVVKSTVLKKVGSKALKGINKKARIIVPKKQIKSYKKIFKGKGQSKKTTIK